MAHIRTDITDRIAHVTLCRADKLNAITLDMIDEVIAAAEALKDQDIACVVLSGEGRGFCAGIDLASLSKLIGQDMNEVMGRTTHGDCNKFQAFSLAWRDLEVPVIAALHGVCFGAGMQLALGADIRIAAPETKCSVMEMKWGIIPDMGGMTILPGLVRSDVLRRLIYTAEIMEGSAVQEAGLVTEISGDPLARAMELAREIADKSPSAIRAAKRLIAVAESADREDVLQAERAEQIGLIGKPDQMAAIAKGMAKRK